MPKNVINEFDRTGSIEEFNASNTVFVPIQTQIGVPLDLYKTEKELKNAFEEVLIEDADSSLEYSLNLGYKLCKHLVKNGLTVLAQGVTTAGENQLAKPTLAIEPQTNILNITQDISSSPDTYYISFVGWDEDAGIVYPEVKFTIHSNTWYLNEHINKKGTYILSVIAAQNGFKNSEVETVSHTLLEDLTSSDINTAKEANINSTKLPMLSLTGLIDWEVLKDKNLYNIRFLTYGAFKADVSQDMINCAKDRGDCVALVNFNEVGSAYDYSLANVNALVANIVNGEYAAAFTPAFFTKHSDFTDAEEVLIPAAFGYLFAYARSIKTNPEWYAIAGFERGVIPELSTLKHKYSTAEVNALQGRTDDSSDNTGRGVNAIAYIRPTGFIIYGNRTLKNNDQYNKLTATSFLNVRNMISAVIKVAYEAANRFTFEQNSDILWVNYKSYIEPTLDRITHGNGALGYSINKIKTTARAKLQAEIIIQPIEAVEDIELSVIMTDTSTAVNE